MLMGAGECIINDRILRVRSLMICLVHEFMQREYGMKYYSMSAMALLAYMGRFDQQKYAIGGKCYHSRM